MGMFDKDKEIGNRIDTEFSLNEDFILWDATVDAAPVATKLGDARKTRLIVSRITDPTTKFECATLGKAIADKAELATDDDFPVVVQLRVVASTKYPGQDALVLQYVRDYDE